MARYITTKADFTLRKKHKKGSGSTIYENDYTTINPLPNAQKGEYVIGDSNFVFTTRLGLNGQKKHVRGKFIPNPSGSTEEGGAWTIDTIIDSGITDETKIRLKPNYTSLTDFACYGSAVKLIQGTINGVITDFPAEMYLSNEEINFYSWNAGYGFDETRGGGHPVATEKRLYNEYEIDITSENVQPESVYNPLRYFALCGSSYTYIDESGITHDFVGFSVTGTASGTCYNGKDVWVDKLADVKLTFSDDIIITIKKYVDYRDRATYYTYTGGAAGGHIRPKKTLIEEYFRNCDDFTAVLLDRSSKPIYSVIFETPYETDTGFRYDMKTYAWPTLNGGYNPDLSGPYYSYLDSLIDVAQFLDEYRTDNIWRSLTHEAIKTLDWTYISNTDGEIEDMSKIDTSRIEPIAKIYGRQFDDLKRYADAIKSINTITYNQKSNTPDYTLTDVLANAGWEVNTLHITTDKDICTDTLYSGLTSGYTAADANTEFMRRLKLNSQYLLATKGTRKGLDTMLALFGFTPDEYKISEYVYVFSGDGNYTSFCGNPLDTHGVKYPMAEEVRAINKYKINYNPLDPYGDFCGIPVVEVGYFVDNPGDPEHPFDCSYVIPWYSQDKKYDDGLYFQMNGGWAKRKRMSIDLEIAPNVKEIDDWGGVVPLYTETQARLKFAKDFDELLQQAYVSSNLNDVFYVTDISKITTDYTPIEDEDMDDDKISHYFILLNKRLNQFLGFSETGGYGWRNIKKDEYENNTTTAGTMVLYLESIKDDTAGNNPHVGRGLYDDGLSYVSGMSEIFNYSLINRNFIGIDDEKCGTIAEYKFDVTKQEDNRKCWFFTDEFSGTTNTLIEADVTEDLCNDSGYSPEEELASHTTNTQNKIGNKAEEYFLSGVDMYNRTTKLDAFDPEGDGNLEAKANSVVNVKNMEVIFDPNVGKNYSGAMKTYIEDTVMPYLTQMMPSTTIWSWSISGETSNKPNKIYKVIFNVINGPADSIIYDGARSGANYSGAINNWELNNVEFYEGDSIAYTAKKGNEIIMGGKYITGSNTAITIDVEFSTTLTFVVANNLTASTINYTVNGGEVQTLTNVTDRTLQPFENGDIISWTAVCSDSEYGSTTSSATINGITRIDVYFREKPKTYSVTFVVTNEGLVANIVYAGTKTGTDTASTENNLVIEGYNMGDSIYYTATCEGYEVKTDSTMILKDKIIELTFIPIPEDAYTVTFIVENGPADVINYKVSGASSEEEYTQLMVTEYPIQNLTGENKIIWQAKKGTQYTEAGEVTVTAEQDINIVFPVPCLKVTPSTYMGDVYSGSALFTAYYYRDCTKESEYEDVTGTAQWLIDEALSNISSVNEGKLNYENTGSSQVTGSIYSRYLNVTSNTAEVIVPGKPAPASITIIINRQTFGVVESETNTGLTGTTRITCPGYDSGEIQITTAGTVTFNNIPPEVLTATCQIDFNIPDSFPLKFNGATGNTSLTITDQTVENLDGKTLVVYCKKKVCVTVTHDISGKLLDIGRFRETEPETANAIAYLTMIESKEDGVSRCTTCDAQGTDLISSSGWQTDRIFGFIVEGIDEATINLLSSETYILGVSNDLYDGFAINALLLGTGGQTLQDKGFRGTFEQLNGSEWYLKNTASV